MITMTRAEAFSILHRIYPGLVLDDFRTARAGYDIYVSSQCSAWVSDLGNRLVINERNGAISWNISLQDLEEKNNYVVFKQLSGNGRFPFAISELSGITLIGKNFCFTPSHNAWENFLCFPANDYVICFSNDKTKIESSSFCQGRE